MAKIVIFCLLSSMLSAHYESRHPPLDSHFLKQLAHRGIELTFNMPFPPNEKTSQPCEIFFPKTNEELLQKWLEFCPLRPNKIVSIDNTNGQCER